MLRLHAVVVTRETVFVAVVSVVAPPVTGLPVSESSIHRITQVYKSPPLLDTVSLKPLT